MVLLVVCVVLTNGKCARFCPGALFQLKRKKMYEKQIDQIYGKKSNIEMQIMALESASSNKELLSAMQTGKAALSASVKEQYVPVCLWV